MIYTKLIHHRRFRCEAKSTRNNFSTSSLLLRERVRGKRERGLQAATQPQAFPGGERQRRLRLRQAPAVPKPLPTAAAAASAASGSPSSSSCSSSSPPSPPGSSTSSTAPSGPSSPSPPSASPPSTSPPTISSPPASTSPSVRRNPNRKLVFVYDDVAVSASSGGVAIGEGTIPGFAQGADSTTVLKAAVSSSGHSLDTAEASNLRNKKRYPLGIEIDNEAGVKIGGFKSKRIAFKASCDGIETAVAMRNATDASIASAKCKVKLRIQIWKWTI